MRSSALRVSALGGLEKDDRLAVEEPLEIRIGDDPVSVTMRTPGGADDYELVAGFLLTEGLISKRADLKDLGYCLDPKHPELRNIVRATLAPGLEVPVERARRRAFQSSSCGLCGKGSLDAVLTTSPPLEDGVRISRAVLSSLPERLRAAQPTFAATGGLHAAGLFSSAGELLCAREDIGRHNAVDKVIGRRFLDGKPLSGTILLVSGRTSFEIVQKALVARIPVLAAVSAASSLAASLARESGMTLVGFLRGAEGNVYAGAERVV